ncbi:hypothetical protein KEM60_02836 [Austwickia sp. TVS 96-490-7B]|uniref:pyridoxal-phosphate dependent enzyme n=1 Tax=Austwickia sp. TVS 96-490-7B TaxID=2830843 RepID=UPI001C59994A|nr:pyridoxal-phosphate dependent enzyme [Austwickia sp. TVS 96-490-7B]MBW3086607.1 hypothetical protein [Austwickia sp. TVS 96-490-7B]
MPVLSPTLDILDHPGQAVGRPDLIALDPDLFTLRFETMKVLSARGALRHLLDEGTLHPGDTVVDSSSGIYAQALALACHELGLHCRIIGSTTVDATTRAQLELLGADLEQMPATDSLLLDQDRRVSRVREMIAAEPDVHWMRQYHDPVHDEGYLPVGQAAAHALADRGYDGVDLVASVGSGVSSFAVAAGMSEVLPVRLTGVQPFGSVTFGADHVDDPDMIIAGIGSSIPFANVRHHAYAAIHWLSHEVACAATTELMRRHGLFAGLSTGAAWLAACHERDRRTTGEDVSTTASQQGTDQVPGEHPATLFIAPDTGHRYVAAVHARHDSHAALSAFSPREVASTQELARPWCRMAWAGRAAPPQAVASDDVLERTPGTGQDQSELVGGMTR